MSLDRGVKKEDVGGVCVCVCVYTMDYYSAIEKKKRMSFVPVEMDFETVMLSEVTQKEKEKCK